MIRSTLFTVLLCLSCAVSVFAADPASNAVPAGPKMATVPTAPSGEPAKAAAGPGDKAATPTNLTAAASTNDSSTHQAVAEPSLKAPATPNSSGPVPEPGTNVPAGDKRAESLDAILAGYDSNSAPPLGQLPPSEMIRISNNVASPAVLLKDCQMRLDLGREQRRQRNSDLAAQIFVALVKDETPREIKRQAMFELALVAQDEGRYLRAQQIFSQYLQTFPEDPSVPEVILRQGLIYRQMGITTLAISKFYAVMYSALKLKLSDMEYYKKIVLQAQVEIADTHYQSGRYDEAVEFLNKLIKSANPMLDLGQTHYKLVRSLSYTSNTLDTVAQAQEYLNHYTNTAEIPEVRFMLASAMKKLGRNNDAMKQVLRLLQSQEQNMSRNPDLWRYWQQRAGNEIATQLYREGDYLNSLQIDLSLAELSKSPAWQLPVWYQTGLVYEQLQQWDKASEMYKKVLARKAELTAENTTPSLTSLLEMTQWRTDYIGWMQKAKTTQQNYVLSHGSNVFANAKP